MLVSKYNCPLCNQPVSKSLFMQITGIWKAREKELAKVKAERSKLKNMQKQFKAEKKRLLKVQQAKLKAQADQRIAKAVKGAKGMVESNNLRYEAKMKDLKAREDRIKAKADQLVAKTTRDAQSSLERKNRQFEVKLKVLKDREQKIKTQADQRVINAVKDAHAAEQQRSKTREQRMERRLKTSMEKALKAERRQAFVDADAKNRKWKISLQSATKELKNVTKMNKVQEARIKELEKQIRKQTTPQLEGLLYEKELMKELQKRFKEDKFVNTGKGGDIIHNVVNDNEEVSTIVYECKRVKNYNSNHIKQIYDAKHARKADFGILVTNAMKRGTNGFFVDKGVIVVHPTGVLHVAGLLRRHTLQISDMKLGRLERDKAIRNTLNYLESPEFSNSIGSIIQDSITLYKELLDEVKRHFKGWKDRYLLYSKINSEANAVETKTKALLSGKEIAEKKTSTLPALLELPEISEESKAA